MKYSNFKNIIKPSRKAATFYCICIIHVYSSKNVFMVVHVYSCLLTGIIPFPVHTGIITWNRTGIFMNIQAYSCSWNFRKAGSDWLG